MSACPQCGTVAKPTDKFCNTCGTRLVDAAAAPPAYAPPPAPQGYGAPPPQAPQAARPPTRCQMGHEIAPGASYCAQGHPMALEAMQFAQDQYAQPPGAAPQGFGAPPGPAGPPFGGQAGFGGYAPQPAPSPIGGPAPGYGAPQPPAMNPQFAPQVAPHYAPQPYAAPQAAPQQPVFNAPAQAPAAARMPSAPPPPPPAPAPFAATTPSMGDAKVLRGFLVAYQSNANGEFWPLNGGRALVGRAGSGESVDIALADPTISSKHAVLTSDAATGSITLEDTGSTNGTFVNEEHIGFNGRRELRDGDRVRFGGFTTLVKVIGRV